MKRHYFQKCFHILKFLEQLQLFAKLKTSNCKKSVLLLFDSVYYLYVTVLLSFIPACILSIYSVFFSYTQVKQKVFMIFSPEYLIQKKKDGMENKSTLPTNSFKSNKQAAEACKVGTNRSR